MALKPTIYKFNIAISDLDRSVYDSLSLTVAQHPSENTERLLARVIAYCFEYEAELSFSKGLSTPDEPDIWLHSLDGQLVHWLDVGEPGFDRLKKAARQSQRCTVYSFNTKSDTWWQLEGEKLSGLAVRYFQLPFDALKSLALQLQRNMDIAITISENTAFVACAEANLEVSRRQLNED